MKLCARIYIFLAISVFGTVYAQSELTEQPCEESDMNCWAVKCNEYSNKLRAEKSAPSLSLGSTLMLENAMDHNKAMDARGSLYHQPIGEGQAVAGQGTECEATLSGENVAYFYKGSGKTNWAYQCVMVQWKNSRGHYNNIINPSFKSGVVGIMLADNGRVYCTQTFVRKSFEEFTGKCAPVSGTAAVSPSPSSAPSQSPMPRPSQSSTPRPSQASMPTASPSPLSIVTSPTPIPSMAPSETDTPLEPSVEPSTEPSLSPGPAQVCDTFANRNVMNVRTGAKYSIMNNNGSCQYCMEDGTTCLTPEFSLEVDKQVSARNSEN